MKKDVESRADLQRILRDFYTRLLSDPILRAYFEKFTEENILEDHLNDLVDFWDGALFYKGSYKKNVMDIHRKIDQERRLNSEHFKAWLSHFEGAVDKFHEGENCETIKSRARSIATVMQIKFREQDQ